MGSDQRRSTIKLSPSRGSTLLSKASISSSLTPILSLKPPCTTKTESLMTEARGSERKASLKRVKLSSEYFFVASAWKPKSMFIHSASWLPRFTKTAPGQARNQLKTATTTSTLCWPRSTKSPLKRYMLVGEGSPWVSKMCIRSQYWPCTSPMTCNVVPSGTVMRVRLGMSTQVRRTCSTSSFKSSKLGRRWCLMLLTRRRAMAGVIPTPPPGCRSRQLPKWSHCSPCGAEPMKGVVRLTKVLATSVESPTILSSMSSSSTVDSTMLSWLFFSKAPKMFCASSHRTFSNL
mmetsp:Transcript_30068/g.64946  ORF Transcript_30068/g.64946 Transcript_30068/m.64946 type:complete len:290 (-) Transcript_30068:1152-2021(-)